MEFHSFFGLFVSLGKEMTSKLIPDEMIVMNAGAMAAHSGLSIGSTFFAVYLALLIVLTTCYCAGATLGAGIQRRRGEQHEKGKGRPAFRHMGWMLCLSLFIPGARYLAPFLAGACRFRFRHYLLAFLPSSFVWTLHYFLAGYWFSDKMEWLAAGVYSYSKIVLTGMLLIALAYTAIRQLRRSGNWFHS